MHIFHVRSRQGDYPVILGRGLTQELLTRMAEWPARGVLVSDSRVARERAAFQDLLFDALPIQRFVLRQGEASKSSSSLLDLLTMMRQSNLERESPVLAVGGGMTGDLAGLAACLFKRGLPFIYVPTSLLAMADASIGGKVAVNYGGQKNLLGQFWPPRLVIADLDHLETLDHRERLCGYAEILKSAWIESDARARQIESWASKMPATLPADLEDGLLAAMLLKKRFVEQDEFDGSERMILNFGHTFAHVLEEESEGELAHGEAVLLGMRASVAASKEVGLAGTDLAVTMTKRFDAVLNIFDLSLPDCLKDPEALNERMMHDKKVKNGKLRLILPAAPGDIRIVEDDGTAALAGWRSLKELL
jgi:3-dehydroquinate synthase